MTVTIDGTLGITTPDLESTGPIIGTTGTFSGAVQASGVTTNLYPIVTSTSQASTSGTSIDFTGIPSWVKRVTVMFSGVSTSGTSPVQIQLGTGATPTFVVTGYNSTGIVTNTGALNSTASTVAFQLETTASTVTATATRHGSAIMSLQTGTTWVEQGSHAVSGSGNALASSGGAIALGATLTAVRITTVNGTDTFDAGTINILYE